jgi:hypothetical protein
MSDDKALVIRIDSNEPYSIEGTFAPAPVDYTIQFEFNWLNVAQGIAVAKAWFGGYWIEGLIGPDGWHELNQHFADSWSPTSTGIVLHKDHPYTEDEVVAAIRVEWKEQLHCKIPPQLLPAWLQ